jgi:hypothetical protein
MKKFLLGALVLSVFALPLNAAVKINIDDTKSIDIGFVLQNQFIMNGETINLGDNAKTFNTRRARLNLGANIVDYTKLFLQTEISGQTVTLIDAWARFNIYENGYIYTGRHMAPASRTNLTSTTALMAIDRPGLTHKTLAWNAGSKYIMNNTYFTDGRPTDGTSALAAPEAVRDNGVTLFGTYSLNNDLHYKYYVGTYKGVQASNNDLRITGRLQVNIGDAEKGYFDKSTYFGNKDTIAIGLSVDNQKNVLDTADKGLVDYSLYTIDLFTEKKVGIGCASFETAFYNLSLGNSATTQQAEGTGYYAQLGYTVDKFQPWVEYETWTSKCATDQGDYTLARVGLTYLIDGHKTNLKVGFERFAGKTGTTTTKQDSVIAGVFFAL